MGLETELVIGNKRYSSWSLRAWLAAVWSGLVFEERVVSLVEPRFRERVAPFGGAGLVPILRIDGEVVWDSLAICETLAERVPAARLWPQEPAARAWARSISAEMHSGFSAVRSEMPMDVGASWPELEFSESARNECQRIDSIWRETRGRFGAGGPYLFGERSIADAMFAPVVFRFETYGVALHPESERYAEALRQQSDLIRWRAEAETESETVDLRRGATGRRVS